MPEATLLGGDLLFRWLQPEETKKTALYRDIAKAQLSERAILKSRVKQDIRHLSHPDESKKWYPRKHLAEVIGHVGIYIDAGKVIEVGTNGISSGKAVGREHTDIVVRFPPDGAGRINDIAQASYDKSGWYPYQRSRVGVGRLRDILFNQEAPQSRRDKAQMQTDPYQPISRDQGNPFLLNPHNSLCVLSGMWPELWKKEKEIKERELSPYVASDARPVCSHYVHAVLYAALCNGTVHAATSPETMHIFSVSPNVLFHYFLNDLGVFEGNQAELVGVQHKARFDRDKTFDFMEGFADYLSEEHKRSLLDTMEALE